jgi:glyceraldehyde-3-phosphate dehydrogenase/erythrose-4-phosphate dehydrogenase
VPILQLGPESYSFCTLRSGKYQNRSFEVNEHILDGTENINKFSCTTNNAAPMMKIIDELWA